MQRRVRVAYVVRSWPRLSQTFILNEVTALERIGVDISIFAMTRADEPLVHPQVAGVAAPVMYLDEPPHARARAHARLFAAAPMRYVSTLLFAFRRRQLYGGYTSCRPLQAFGNAALVADAVSAQRVSRPFTQIHAHFAHDPALVGLLAHRLTGLPFSFTAHARDLYQIPDAALRARVREATAVVTCCHANVEHMTRLADDREPPRLIYHGVDLTVFRPAAARNGRSVPQIVSVGRLVEKKGFDDLLKACALLTADGKRFACDIYGDGPQRSELEALRDQLGLAETVRFRAARTHDQLLPIYQDADVFALTPRVTGDGDRDGVPNTIVEAMACGLPVVSTRVGGTHEAVSDGVDGLLASSSDVSGIAGHLATLLDDAVRRRRMGEAAARSAQRFDSQASAQSLAALFGHAPRQVQ